MHVYNVALQKIRKNKNYIRREESVLGRAYIDHKRKEGHENLVRDYFSPTPIYGNVFFRRRSRMSRNLFFRIHDKIVSYYSYFVQSYDVARKEGLSSLQQINDALCI